ncbi:Mss4-like protein [Mycena sanguinolenta]|nr:Mss4-like protein [Mycena sanguinolenta]
MPSQTNVRKGSCFCGEVSFIIEGKPLFSLYCHCTQCQRADGAAFVSSMHYAPFAFEWTYAAENKPEEETLRGFTMYRCKKCRSCAATQMGETKNWALRGTQLERDENGKIKNWDDVKPSCHIFYGTRVVEVADDLPKWEGFPNQSARLG